MEEVSQGDTKLFSVRIVSIDYYMSPPISLFDISYSNFQGASVKEVPVIRIFGSTPAGQKACIHVHRALPYLYIPCSDIPLQLTQQGSMYENAVSLAIEKALKLKGNAGSKRQHVHSCSLVRARKIYGYHSYEELFVKIYLYYPHDVSRAANLLLSGAVFEKPLQPYESHIPFLLQFLVDYNLYGMGHMHLVKMKFRHPVPDDFSEDVDPFSAEAFVCRFDSQADATASSSSLLVWRSSTIPDEWMWQTPAHDPSSSNVDSITKRQSTCELEGDTTIEDILNQQLKMYTSLSQTRSDVRMVQSLVPIWEEEFERSGVHEAEILDDPFRPPPEDVLQTLSNGINHMDKLRELYSAEESTMLATSEGAKSMVSAECLREEQGLVVPRNQDLDHLIMKSSEELNNLCEVLSPHSMPDKTVAASSLGEKGVDESDVLHMMDRVDMKVADPEDVALLKWLASAQAEEDINSDDELHQETILSPLLPSATIDKVLEKANTDYENESQQECQDILDSIVDPVKMTSSGEDLLNTKIPQLDGAGDDQHLTPAASSPEKLDIELVSSKCHTSSSGNSSFEFDKNQKRHKSLWGSLPISEVQQTTGVVHYDPSTMSANYSGNCAVDSRTLVGCSVRDLMRKKRSFRVELSESGKGEVGGYVKDTSDFLPRKLDFHIEPSEEQYNKFVEAPTSSHVQINEQREACEFEHRVCVHCPGEKEKQDLTKFSMADKYEELVFDMPSRKSSTLCLNTLKKLAVKSLLEVSDCNDMVVDEKCGQVVQSSSSCVYKCERKGNSCRNGNHTGKDGNDLGISTHLVYSLTSKNIEGNHGPADSQYDKCTVVQCSDNCAKQVFQFGSIEEKNPREYISMTYHKKPPLANWKNGRDQTAVSLPVQSGCSLNYDSDYEETSVKGVCLQDVLPFFPASGKVISEQSNGSGDLCPDALMGVPTHYQNDGSRTYLLTPAVSPPSIDSVLEWLELQEKAHVRATPSPVSSQFSPLEPVNKGEDHRSGIIGGDHMTDRVVPGSDKRSPLCAKEMTKVSQDISQISGPSGQSKPTPLSQIGFRDPASLGAGQQLTLLSIEVQAESRGDLRPDPQYDTINIIVMMVQNDSSPSADIHVLMRGPTENSGRNLDGISGSKMFVYSEEKELLEKFISITCLIDPDILIGWDIQGSSLGFLAERASHLGISLINKISRIPTGKKVAEKNLDSSDKGISGAASPDSLMSNAALPDNDNAIIEDEWGRTHASGVHVTGRIVLNVWRLVRSEVKLNMYSLEAVAEAVLRRKVPSIHWKILNKWFSSGPAKARFRCVDFLVERTKLNIDIVNQLDMINRTSELARVFGIDFFSVLSRGSQYRVESMLVRLAHTQNYVLISPGHQQVASQPAMECLPLVMEPESGFYSDPVVVLDFQALYPSMIIAYNLCFSTCLGNVVPSKAGILGVSSYSQDLNILKDISRQILVTPNGVMYVPSKVRKGVLPRLLDEILATRVMVKQAMKTLAPSQQILQRIFNSRQLALKLIANVTYGYTAAGFSGRMPCAELADSIVQCGRRTLENAISFVNSHDQWKARVIYGDTDSMFVLLEGRTMEEAFQIGNEIASTITAMNPNPVKLKMEKVYKSCFLLTKKRYVGYSYERLNQLEPIFDAKGIETIRRDTCPAVAKTMEKSLRMFFEYQDVSKVRAYLQRQWSRILSGRVSIKDFVFAKEVRLGTYSTRTSASLPPAAIVASKAMRVDPRAEPRYAERVLYVVVHGEPGARLVDLVVDPHELLSLDSPYRLNDLYYIRKQIIPALQRVFGLVGGDLSQWFQEMPRPVRDAPTRRHFSAANSLRARIDFYYSSKHCVLCGELAQALSHLCEECSQKGPVSAAALTGRTSKLERDIQHLVAICRHCGGGDWLVESGVKCTSLACSVYYERQKVQKELRAFSTIATEAGFYPRCVVEWF